MSHKTETFIAFSLCLLIVLGTIVPYFVALRLAQPNEFSGFLINPIDGFSYLAKMNQGAQGEWFFRLPYAADPGRPVFLFGYYIFLGHVSGFLHISLLTLYHLARVLAAMAMFWVGFHFFRTFLPDRFERWFAFLLTLFGAGLGWIFGFFGIETSDLSIPESIPFQTAYTNAHFPIANLLILGVVIVIVSEGSITRRAAIACLCGILLAIVLPFSLASLILFLSLWLVWETVILYRAHNWQVVWRKSSKHFIPFLAFGIGAGPLLLYDFWLTKAHPVIALWNSQNQTPSPAIISYLVGYSPVLLFALLAILHRETRASSRGRLLVIWVISNILLLYAPFSLQRRLTLGLYFPLAGLAAVGFRKLISDLVRRRLILVFMIFIIVPSNLILVYIGLDRVRISDPEFIHWQGEIPAYEWLNEHVPGDSLILAAADTGNRLPAFADVRVLYGHPFETPNAEQQETLVSDLFRWDGHSDEGIQELILLGVDYVFYGQREMDIGTPTWLSKCSSVYEAENVRIFRVGDS